MARRPWRSTEIGLISSIDRQLRVQLPEEIALLPIPCISGSMMFLIQGMRGGDSRDESAREADQCGHALLQ